LDEIPDSWKDYIDAGVIRARRNQIFMPYPFLKKFWSDNATVFSKEDMDLIWTDSTQSHNDSTDKGYSFQIGVAMELLFQSKSKLFLAIYNKIKEITGLKLDIQIPSNFDKFRKIDRFNTDVELKEKRDRLCMVDDKARKGKDNQKRIADISPPSFLLKDNHDIKFDNNLECKNIGSAGDTQEVVRNTIVDFYKCENSYQFFGLVSANFHNLHHYLNDRTVEIKQTITYLKEEYRHKIWKIDRVFWIAYKKSRPWSSMHIDVIKKIISYAHSDFIDEFITKKKK